LEKWTTPASSNIPESVVMIGADAEYNKAFMVYLKIRHMHMIMNYIQEIEDVKSKEGKPLDIYMDNISAADIIITLYIKNARHPRHIPFCKDMSSRCVTHPCIDQQPVNGDQNHNNSIAQEGPSAQISVHAHQD
jgi:hypothetical protein